MTLLAMRASGYTLQTRCAWPDIVRDYWESYGLGGRWRTGDTSAAAVGPQDNRDGPAPRLDRADIDRTDMCCVASLARVRWCIRSLNDICSHGVGWRVISAPTTGQCSNGMRRRST